MGTRKGQTTASGPGTWIPRIQLPFLLSYKFFFRLQKTAKKQGKDIVQAPRLFVQSVSRLQPKGGTTRPTAWVCCALPVHPTLDKVREKLTVLPNSEIESLKVKATQSCPTLCDLMDYTVHGILQARILEWVTSLLQGIVPIQGSNPALPHFRQILYQLSHQEKPRILEQVAYPFSSGSSQPRNRTQVSCIAGGFSAN